MDGQPINYKVYLTKDVNAWAMDNGCMRVYSGLMDLMREALITVQFSQSQETAADNYPFDLLTQLKLERKGLVTGFQKMADLSGKSSAVEPLLSSHPPSDKRVHNLQTRKLANSQTRKLANSQTRKLANSLASGPITARTWRSAAHAAASVCKMVRIFHDCICKAHPLRFGGECFGAHGYE